MDRFAIGGAGDKKNMEANSCERKEQKNYEREDEWVSPEDGSIFDAKNVCRTCGDDQEIQPNGLCRLCQWKLTLSYVVKFDSKGDMRCPHCGGTFLLPLGTTFFDDEVAQSEYVCDDCQTNGFKLWNRNTRAIIKLG